MRGLLTLLLLLALPAAADGPPASGGAYRIESWTIDAGGGESSGDDLVLRGTLAQHDAGPLLAGGGYELQGGFWPGTNNPRSTLYRDSFE